MSSESSGKRQNRYSKRTHGSSKSGENFNKRRNNKSFRKSSSSKSSFRRQSSGRCRGKGGNKKFIPVEKFIHKGVELKETKYDASMPFSEFPLVQELKDNIQKLGWDYPTEVQDRSFMPVSELKDVMAIANTGTGKTGSFLIPLINAMLVAEEDFSALVMVPTRELALQVESEFRLLTKGMQLFAACFIGGQNIGKDLRKLQNPFHFVIGTPGRLVDLNRRNALKFEYFSVLILDEFDRMLDMGFSKDVNYITSQMKVRDQTLLFSATLDQSQKEIIDGILKNPVNIQITDGSSTAEHIDQDVVYSNIDNKFDKLLSMLKEDEFQKVLIFAETKRRVSGLAKQLKKSKFKVDEIHGDKSQNYRKHALNDFKKGKVKVLVATDVAARGLDISDVTHVINYEVPNDYETYIHRIGRTGRAGKKGKAYTFVNKN